MADQARAQARPFQELLSTSPWSGSSTGWQILRSPTGSYLKGALLTAWQAPVSRPTIDIDLAGRTSNTLGHISELVRSVCGVITEPDGLEFDPASIEAARIKEGAEYEGVRIRFNATLALARIPMQIDIGFGDVIVPAPTHVVYPTLLEFPAPVLLAYPKETVVAEEIGSALKDY